MTTAQLFRKVNALVPGGFVKITCPNYSTWNARKASFHRMRRKLRLSHISISGSTVNGYTLRLTNGPVDKSQQIPDTDVTMEK